jgi:hypothetical protein
MIIDKIKYYSGSCILADNMFLVETPNTKVMSCQKDLCNSPAIVLPKLSKSILCSDGFYV